MKVILALLVLLTFNANAIEQSQIDGYGFGVSLDSNRDGSGFLFELSSKNLFSFENVDHVALYRIYLGLGSMFLPNTVTSTNGKLTSAAVGSSRLGLMMTSFSSGYDWFSTVKIGIASLNPSSDLSGTSKTGLEVEIGNEWVTSDKADFFGHKGVSTFCVKVAAHPSVISDKNATERAYLTGYTMGMGFRYYF